MIENEEYALNHLDLSGMVLKFEACSKIIGSVAKSKQLCALHLSRNGILPVQKKLLVRQLGIPESDLDGSEKEQNDIVNDIFNKTIKSDKEHVHPTGNIFSPSGSKKVNPFSTIKRGNDNVSE